MIKYYAVKKGLVPGIYTSWTECESLIKNYSGAKYKSFRNFEDAQKYLTDEKDAFTNTNDSYNIYVDGSYCNNKYAWAFVVYDPDGKEIYYDFGLGTNPDANNLRNVAGELSATMRAVNWIKRAKLKNAAIIHHDYQGISAWITGKWKAKNEFTKKYVDFCVKDYENKLFSFNKVAGHAGVKGNERADELCSKAFLCTKEAI